MKKKKQIGDALYEDMVRNRKLYMEKHKNCKGSLVHALFHSKGNGQDVLDTYI